MSTDILAVKPGDSAQRSGLVDAAWLEAHLTDPTVRVVEVDVNRANYDRWHIDGAVLWNVYQDLKDGDYRSVDRSAIEALVRRSGIGPGSTVVFYGYAPAMGFWLMRRHQHLDCRVLDCSRDAWKSDGRPWTTETAQIEVTSYQLPDADQTVWADLDATQGAVDDPTRTLVDVRSTAEYAGDCFWPSGGAEPGGRSGHIPGAVHQPIDGLLDERGAFRSSPELRKVFAAVDPQGDQELITYCTIGGRASTAWFVLTQILGRRHVRVYDGSWAEWGRVPSTPVA